MVLIWKISDWSKMTHTRWIKPPMAILYLSEMVFLKDQKLPVYFPVNISLNIWNGVHIFQTSNSREHRILPQVGVLTKSLWSLIHKMTTLQSNSRSKKKKFWMKWKRQFWPTLWNIIKIQNMLMDASGSTKSVALWFLNPTLNYLSVTPPTLI